VVGEHLDLDIVVDLAFGVPQNRSLPNPSAALLLFTVLSFSIFIGSVCAQTPAQAEKANRAKSLLAQNKFAEAAVLYTELAQQIPNNPGLLLNQGIALHMSGADARAIAPLEAALKLNPNLTPARLLLGSSLLRTGKPALALPQLERFIAATPNDADARQMAIEAAFAAGQPARAIPHLDKLGLYYDLGRTYETLAAQTFSQLEKLYPESGPFFALLGFTRNKSSQRRAAFFFYRKALEKSPNLRGIHAAIAEIYRATDHPEWALSEEAAEARLPAPTCQPLTPECEFVAGHFENAARLARTTSVTDLYWRTRAYQSLAADSFQLLLAQKSNPDSWRYAAELARSQNLHSDAAEAWREAIKLAPDNADLKQELASTLLTLKAYEEAQQIATALLAKEPNAPDLNLLQGEIYLAQQLPDKAEPFLLKAVKADAKYLPARASLARALLAQGKATAALPHVTAALPLDTDGSLHIQLARALQSAGRADDARAAMAKYQDIQSRNKAQEKVIEEEVKITPP
jgi:predicted Zn-dependent protease